MFSFFSRLEPEEGSFLEIFKYWDLLVQLVSRDVKLKYRRSFLGYVWSILNPLSVMIIMAIVFSFLFSRGVEFFPIYLLAGKCTFDFIQGSADKSIYAITDNDALLKKTYVPKYMFPVARITATMIDFFFSLGAMIIVMLVYSIIEGRCLFSFANLGFVIPLIESFIFALGLGLLLSAAHVFFRDVRYIFNAFITALMYASAIFYSVDMFYENSSRAAYILAKIIEFANPIYIYIKQLRYFLWVPALSGDTPYWCMLHVYDFALGFAYAFVMFFIGVKVFRKTQDKFILYI